PWCPVCLDERWEWQALSGRGTVLSKLVFHQSYHPAWKDRLPYNVVLVQLEEGPRMISNVLPLTGEDFAVGDAVEVAFDPEGEVTIPRFRVAG
ncbi:OB-fold domain-containing protein, partial [Schumannella luteola]